MKEYIKPENFIMKVEVADLLAFSLNSATPEQDDEENLFINEQSAVFEDLWNKGF